MNASIHTSQSPRSRRRLPLVALLAATLALPAAVLALPGFLAADAAGGRSELYREGQRQLSEQRWEAAAATFARLAAAGGDETDAALYWKAYSESKAGDRGAAMTTLRQLRSGYPESAWQDDAAALEIELRGAPPPAPPVPSVPPSAAQPPRAPRPPREPRAVREGRASPEAEPPLTENEELKLYALDGLLQADPERAIPVLERFLTADNPPRLKERALFVLSQSDSSRAREILVDTARAGQPIELRVQAVRMLGIAGEPEDLAALGVLFSGASPEVRSAVLEAYMIAGDPDPLVSVLRSETDPQLRGRAIEMLGAMEATSALEQLWGAETDPQLRGKLLEAFAISDNVAALARAARSETDPALRAKAIEGLGIAGGDAAGRELLAIYRASADARDKEKVLQGLMISNDAKALLTLLREEKDPALKKQIVQQLSMLDAPEAEEAIFQLLEEKP